MIETGYDINSINITGNVVKAPDFSKPDVMFFQVATSRLKYRDEGKANYTTDLHSIVCKGSVLEKLKGEKLEKGMRVSIQGVLAYWWRDQNVKYPSAEILAETVKIL